MARYGTLRDTLADSARASWDWIRGKRQTRHREYSNEIWALKDVSFEVNWGDAVGVIGRNGAGKSTLLKILSRITEPTRGRAFMHARAASLLEVGTGFHHELTGRENIYFNGAILGMRRAEIARKFDEIVSFAEIEKFVDTPVKHYSSGMYVRLAFSVAAHLDADILLIDEVLAVGDVNFQKKCLERTSQMAKQGRTVMLVSHSMPTIANLCNAALYLKQGQMVRYGDVGTVVSLYMQDSVGAHMLSRDVSTLRRTPGLGDSLRLESVRVVLRKEALYYNDPLEIEIVARAKSAISGLVFGIGVSNGFGVRLLSAESDEDPIEVASGELVRVNITIPMPYLPPGSYALEAGARSGPRFMLDYLPEVILFEVAPRFNEVHISDRPEIGLRPLTTWSFDRRS